MKTAGESLKIVFLCIAASVVYGILHDQVTARVCVEYFTIGHPPVFRTEDPTLLAFGWGVIATWWMGAILSFPAVTACRVGSLPKFDTAGLVRPISVLLIVMAVASLAAGVGGYCAARAGVIRLEGSLAELVSPEKHVAFLADRAAHLTAYGVGFLGGIVLSLWVLFQRWRLARSVRQSV
jgi:hypothetical protein